MLMTEPRWSAGRPAIDCIAPTAARVPRNTPSRLTRISARHSSRLVSISAPRAATPALLTRTSSLPNALRVASITPAHPASAPTSWASASAMPPAAVMSSTTSAAGASAMSVSTTRAPSRASARALAAPIPEPAPVTIATLPATRCVIVHSARQRPRASARTPRNRSPPPRRNAPRRPGSRRDTA